ncbi:flavin-containing monooxygenase [Streptomyces huiliensis]|uniref:flavin-containing monooxygenase n=1 Tax=Streptomyces huiliensis TaxID=2876027 RepID=UPI001CBD3577|nr:NAD(P)/FAD-dependent oxidoreductase [Streptomyces huiliensis]
MFVETVIVGGGQQGCGVAGALSRLGYESLVLERGEVGQAWAHERWDSLYVNTPNRMVDFPGWPYDGDDPEGFMPAREVAERLRRYVSGMGIQVRERTAVRAVESAIDDPSCRDARFRVHLADDGEVIECRNLVAALGGYASPRVPDVASDVDPSITQLHSSHYRNPQSLPDGAVLVVGAGSSGQQIAEDVRESGREVYLAVGRHKTAPRFYRGACVLDWLRFMSIEGNFESAPVGRDLSPSLPGASVLSGRDGGRDLNLSILAKQGVTLVGSVRAAEGTVLALEDNVRSIAEAAARAELELLDAIDAAIEKRGLEVPDRTSPTIVDISLLSGYGETLDLKANDITTVIWATGFVPDYGILPGAALDEQGTPVHRKGVGALPGLYYAGLPEGRVVRPLLIGATRSNGEFIARQIQLDNVLRQGSPAAAAQLWSAEGAPLR